MNPQIPQYPQGRPATATIVVTTGAIQGKKVTINGTDYTLGTHFFGSTPHVIARNLAAAINGDLSSQDGHVRTNPVGPVFAVYYGATVRLISTAPGALGNSVTLTTDSAASFTLSGASLSGGVGPSGAATGQVQTTVTVALTTVPGLLSITSKPFRKALILGRLADNSADNTTDARIGLSSVDGTQPMPLVSGGFFEIVAPEGSVFDLASYYLDVGTNGDGAIIWYSL